MASALSSALSDATRLRLVTVNVAAEARKPRLPDRRPRAWTGEQVSTFLVHVEGNRLAPLWRFLAVTGYRRGKALGLRWADVDLDTGTATITNQRTMAHGRVVEGPPKTRSGARTVALDEETLALLRAWRREQVAEMLAAGVPGGYVFTGRKGGKLDPQRTTERFKLITEELGLPHIGIHGLRHSSATWHIAQGHPPKLVAQRLGHAHVSVALDLYSHVTPAYDRAAAEAFAAAGTHGRRDDVAKMLPRRA